MLSWCVFHKLGCFCMCLFLSRIWGIHFSKTDSQYIGSPARIEVWVVSLPDSVLDPFGQPASLVDSSFYTIFARAFSGSKTCACFSTCKCSSETCLLLKAEGQTQWQTAWRRKKWQKKTRVGLARLEGRTMLDLGTTQLANLCFRSKMNQLVTLTGLSAEWYRRLAGYHPQMSTQTESILVWLCQLFSSFFWPRFVLILRHQTSKSSRWMANRKQTPEMTSAIAQSFAVDGYGLNFGWLLNCFWLKYIKIICTYNLKFTVQ